MNYVVWDHFRNVGALCGEPFNIFRKTKWPMFCRHFQMHFLQSNIFISIQISLKSGPISPHNKLTRAQLITLCRTGAKPLPGPIITWFTDVCMRLQASSTLQWRNNGHDSVSNHQPHDCLLNRLFRRRSKKTSKLRVTGLCAGNSPGTGEFPAQMASNAENVSIWWRHHGVNLLFPVRSGCDF